MSIDTQRTVTVNNISNTRTVNEMVEKLTNFQTLPHLVWHNSYTVRNCQPVNARPARVKSRVLKILHETVSWWWVAVVNQMCKLWVHGWLHRCMQPIMLGGAKSPISGQKRWTKPKVPRAEVGFFGREQPTVSSPAGPGAQSWLLKCFLAF